MTASPSRMVTVTVPGAGATLAMLTSRPCRRTALLIAVWTCFCWLLFRASHDDNILQLRVGICSAAVLQWGHVSRITCRCSRMIG